MFRQQRESSTKKQDERARRDPVKSHRPDLPVYGPGMYLNFNCMVEQKHLSLFPMFCQHLSLLPIFCLGAYL